ncbi:MAG: amino acid ABC transporter substrate-binding protein [Flavobacteriaceae bacterium]
MTSAPNLLQPLSGSRFLYGLLLLVGILLLPLEVQAQDPDASLRTHFFVHKVRKGETAFGLSQRYNISEEQLLHYNPEAANGLKRRTKLKIPRYRKLPPKKAADFKLHTVQKGETRWRIAYTYGITLEALQQRNPEMGEVLEIGQQLRIPLTSAQPSGVDPNFNYYTVKPKEGYYRIEKKLGISRDSLLVLNPQLAEKGLLAGMVLKIPKTTSSKFDIQDNLLVEKANLRDSVRVLPVVKLALMAPFRLPTISLDSLEQTAEILQSRNLATLSLDFYAGARMAVDELVANDLSIDFSVFDTENSTVKIQKIVRENDFSDYDFVVGPFIPKHFNAISAHLQSKNIPVVSPLTTNPLVMRPNVVHSMPKKEDLQQRMLRYIDSLDTTEENPCVLIVADQKSNSMLQKLKSKFPLAEVIRPDAEFGFVKPELVDSLSSNFEPNWVFLEADEPNLVISMTSMLNAQQSEERSIQLLTTYRDNVYDDDNIDQGHLGNLRFTYTAAYNINPVALAEFQATYQERFGAVPSREAVRGYELVLDLILRTATRRKLFDGFSIGETQYLQNKFLFEPDASGLGYRNNSIYLLQHQGFETIELNE